MSIWKLYQPRILYHAHKGSIVNCCLNISFATCFTKLLRLWCCVWEFVGDWICYFWQKCKIVFAFIFQKQPLEVLYEERVLLKISQHSHENAFVGVSLSIKFQPRGRNFIKKETPTQFAKFLGSPFFTEHLRAIASLLLI